MKQILLVIMLPHMLLSLNGDSRRQLLTTLEKINDVQRVFVQEKKAWDEERQSLELKIKIMEDLLHNSKLNQVAVMQQIEDLISKKKSLKSRLHKIAESELKLKDILKINLQNLNDNIAGSLPLSLAQLIKDEALSLKASLNKDEIELLSHLPVMMDYFNAVFDLQKNIHLVKEVVDLPKGKQLVTVIYIGTYKGFFITKDEKTAGELIRVQGKWQATVNNSLLLKVKKALIQFNREGKPELVALPVAGGK